MVRIKRLKYDTKNTNKGGREALLSRVQQAKQSAVPFDDGDRVLFNIWINLPYAMNSYAWQCQLRSGDTFDIPKDFRAEIKDILANGAEHDGQQCEYTMCYSGDYKIKNKCLGWCDRMAVLLPLSKEENYITRCRGKILSNGFCDTCYQISETSSSFCGRYIKVSKEESQPIKEIEAIQVLSWFIDNYSPIKLNASDLYNIYKKSNR